MQTKLVVFVAKGKTKHEPKFQLSSSNSLGDMSNCVIEIEDQKRNRFHHLFVENLVLAEIAKVQGASEAKFLVQKIH